MRMMSYDRPPLFFLLTTLKPPHSGCVGFGCVLTTSAIETGFPEVVAPRLDTTSALRLLTNSDAKRRPSSVVLFSYIVSDMSSTMDGSGSRGNDNNIKMISSTAPVQLMRMTFDENVENQHTIDRRVKPLQGIIQPFQEVVRLRRWKILNFGCRRGFRCRHWSRCTGTIGSLGRRSSSTETGDCRAIRSCGSYSGLPCSTNSCPCTAC